MTVQKLDSEVFEIAPGRFAGRVDVRSLTSRAEHGIDRHPEGEGQLVHAITSLSGPVPESNLAAIFSEIYEGENSADREKAFKSLAKMNPKHVETKTMMAEMYLQAEDFPNARRSLGDAYEKAPNVRTLTIIAAIEKGEGADDSVIRKWLTKALSAPRGPQWVCENCSTVHSVWRPTCFNCNALDTLTWTDVPETNAELASGSERAPFVLDVLNSNDSETAQIDLEEEESLTELENVEIDDDSSKS